MPEDQLPSWVALVGVAAIYAKGVFERIMSWLERRRNGDSESIVQRLDRMEREGSEFRRRAWTKLGEIEVTCGRLDERVKVLER